ncbi:MAG: hypothetical protein WBS33_07500 [Verrucomicrobiia bacterium]
MLKLVKQAARKTINCALGMVGCEVVRISKKIHNWEDQSQFLPLEETLAGAREAHLSLGEYIDTKHNVPGATQATHDRLVAIGVFKDRIDRVCEIGPGSGRFLEKTIQACKPSLCEIYETADPWREWLVKTHNVIAQPTDGMTLASTPSNSIDLIQAHKVFVCLLFVTTCSYFMEMIRVTRPGAWVIFDVMTEDCLENWDVPIWLQKGAKRTYPAIMPKKFVINFFQGNGFRLVESFIVPMKPGKTECMVFRKRSS